MAARHHETLLPGGLAWTPSAPQSKKHEALLRSAVQKLVWAGESAGITPEEMIEFLETGSVIDLLDYISARLTRRVH